ncbi:MAG: 16S rRNA (guanine(966)-N(2))-methyltransferase RsmD [Betaproteobacteria bacterium]
MKPKQAFLAKSQSAHRAKKTPSKTKPVVARSGVGEVRIIGGQWKRTKLRVLDLAGLRPTPDRVRETLFNWLGQNLQGWRCVDAFSGTGTLGFEAASRGAAQVLMVEQHPALVAQLLRTQAQLGTSAVRVTRGDGIALMEQLNPSSVDLLLLDPPFESTQFEEALQAAARAVAASGFIYLEAPRAWSDEELAAFGLARYRYLKAGAVHAHLLKPRADSRCIMPPQPSHPLTESNLWHTT